VCEEFCDVTQLARLETVDGGVVVCETLIELLLVHTLEERKYQNKSADIDRISIL
jgi:hypothetical protein